MRRGIPFNAFFVTTLLATLLALIVALISLRAHQNAMRNLVAERDQRAVRYLSALVSDQLTNTDDPIQVLDANLAALLENQENSAVFAVNGQGEIVYQRGDLHDGGATLLRHEGVAEGLAGEEGILFTPASDGEHIVAYTQIESTDWALVLEEPVQQVLSMRLNSTLIAPLTVLPLLGVMLLAVWFGGRQIVRPLQLLAQRADSFGDEDYDVAATSVGGISEIRHLEQHLQTMAERVSKAQRSLRSYAGAVTLGQEEERRRLARELHDGAIQTLTVMHQEVQLAKWDASNGTGSMLAQIDTQIADLTREMRRMIRAMRPSYLEELGLVAALETLSQEYSDAWNFPITFEVDGEEVRLDTDEELALYRISQEALNNIRQHAEATQAIVYLNFGKSLTRMTILDDGRGFDAPQSLAETATAGHFGLIGVFERAELIQAEVAIHSTRGRGTEFCITIPYSTDQ